MAQEIGTADVKSHLPNTGAYQHSFGALPDNFAYYNPWMGVDERKQLKEKLDIGLKAYGTTSATAGGPGTAGVAMVPVYVDPRIVDTTRKYTPWVEAIPRVTNIGLTADYNIITAKGTAVAAAEDAALAEQDDTYDRASTAIKYFYAVGRVSGQSRASYPSYILEGFQATGAGLAGTGFSPSSAPNAKQLAMLVKARALREFEEETIWNGSTSDDANEFSGIITLQAAENTVDKNTSALEYDDIETAVRYAFDDGGRPNIAGCSSDVLTDIRKIVIDTFNYRPSDMTTTLPFGVSSHLVLDTMVGPIPVIPSMNISNTTGNKAIYFLDMNYIEMRVLQDMTYEEFAKTNDSEKFMLKIYEALIMKNTAFNSSITEISA